MQTSVPVSRERTRRILQALALPLFGVLAGLVVAEVALRGMVRFRILDPSSKFVCLVSDLQTESLFRTSADPILGHEFIPSRRRGHVRINSAGFRGREYPREVPPDTIRVAVLGDSESVGLLLPEEEAFSGSLERSLNQLAGVPRKFEVLDFGVPGYNIDQKLAIMGKALEYNPSIVILYYVFNDPQPGATGIVFSESLLSNSYLYLLLTWSVELTRPSTFQVLHQDKSLTGYFQELHESEYFRRSRELIKQTGDFLEKRGIRFVVVIAPELLGFDDFRDYPHRNIHAKLLELSAEAPQVITIDPLEDLAASGYKATELWTNPYDCHKGGIANDIIAKSIVRQLFPR